MCLLDSRTTVLRTRSYDDAVRRKPTTNYFHSASTRLYFFVDTISGGLAGFGDCAAKSSELRRARATL